MEDMNKDQTQGAEPNAQAAHDAAEAAKDAAKAAQEAAGEGPNKVEPTDLKQPEVAVKTVTPPGQPDIITKTVATPGGVQVEGPNTVARTAIDPMHSEAVIQSSKEAAAKAKDTVTMSFPRPLLLTVNHDEQIKFDAGVQEVSKELVDHPYLKANGVRPYDASQAAPAGAPAAGATANVFDITTVTDEAFLVELKARLDRDKVTDGHPFEKKAEAVFLGD